MTAVWTFFRYPPRVLPRPLQLPSPDNRYGAVSGPGTSPEVRSGPGGPHFSLIDFSVPLLHVSVFYTSPSTCKATYKRRYGSIHRSCPPPIPEVPLARSALQDQALRTDRKYVLNSLFSCLI